MNPVVWRQCRAAIVDYSLNASFTNGIQKITHTIGEERRSLPTPMPRSFHVGNGSDFGPMNSVQEYVNLVSLVDSLSNKFDLEGRHIVQFTFNMADLENPHWLSLTSDDGIHTSHQACTARIIRDPGMQGTLQIPLSSSTAEQRKSNKNAGSSIMALSVFNTNRLNSSDLYDLDLNEFDTSEKLLNEALINITISSFSLDVHYEMANGTSTRVFNVYWFDK
jgi:hypothetical protein